MASIAQAEVVSRRTCLGRSVSRCLRLCVFRPCCASTSLGAPSNSGDTEAEKHMPSEDYEINSQIRCARLYCNTLQRSRLGSLFFWCDARDSDFDFKHYCTGRSTKQTPTPKHRVAGGLARSTNKQASKQTPMGPPGRPARGGKDARATNQQYTPKEPRRNTGSVARSPVLILAISLGPPLETVVGQLL
jgi:hypothetical protein